MKVVLLRDVAGLGKIGEVREVHDGYGRNFLLVRGLAEIATPQVLNRLNNQKRSQEKHQEKEKSEALALKLRLEKINPVFKVKIGEKGQPFGSITPAKIMAELEKQGIHLKKESLPAESIKTLGSHNIKIKLPDNTEAELKITIKAESSSTPADVKTAVSKKITAIRK